MIRCRHSAVRKRGEGPGDDRRTVTHAPTRRIDLYAKNPDLYRIDRQLVFWRTEGACMDAAWFHALYDGTSLDPLCVAYDSIVGPRQACRDAGARALFPTIEDHLTAEDL